ncbi:hypothetical protein, partial [Burkholderia pseudomallei]
SSNLVPEVPCDQAIPPPDIHKIRRQVTQSFSKAPRFSAMNLFFGSAHEPVKDSWAIAQPDAGLARRAAGK